jgi:eukaryotic-like serine/threonine-protein kinase
MSGLNPASDVPTAGAESDPLLGRVLNDRYRVLEAIGRGGMGRVYKALQAPLDRVVALKVLGAGHDRDPNFYKRFFLEASVTAKLTHPNTITLYDYGRTEDAVFFIAMEYLDGRTLSQVIQSEGALAQERVIHIAQQVCRSLREAHSLGIIHRDLKPANVMLLHQQDDHDFVKVLDFGLVKYDQDESILDTIKSAELTTGTPAYMAPEMASGADPVDRRADLYALGCVGYWLMTGQMVFEADSPLKMLIQHIQAIPVPPSIRTGRPVPLDLERAIMRCLEKDPTRRPQTADELLADLDRVALEHPWDQSHARTWWEENIAPPAAPRASAPQAVLAVG